MRAINVLQANNCCSPPPFINLHSGTNKRPFPRKSTSSSILNHMLRTFSIHQFLRNPNLKVGGGRTVGIGVVKGAKLMEIEDGDLIVETCITRDLSPALTLQRGLEMITVEIEKLKSNPPYCSSGVYRFQVAVPPSPKALNWFCCQPKSSVVFPQFFISKETDTSTFKSMSLKGTRGVFGVGAAVYFTRSSSCTPGGFSSFLRYLSPDSRLMIAYGFLDIHVKSELSYVEKESGSFYFLIPQVELAEHGGISILTATLVWNDVSLCTFEEAVHSFELSLQQVF